VQYFERAVFELHPENQPPFDVLLTLLGALDYKERYPNGAPGQEPNTGPASVLFKETGKRVGGPFLAYWQSHGGLAQQGYPISDEFQAISPLDGKQYTIQYFQRAVFELHPENKGTPYEVLLSQLGTLRFRDRYIYPDPAISILPERIRLGFDASESYIVWEEATYNNGIATGSSDIFGWDLKANKPVDVTTNEPNDQSIPSISSSIMVYQSQVYSTHIGLDYVRGKDLATGATYEVSNGPAPARSPKIAGKSVVWMEFDDKVQRLLTKDLDQATPLRITEIPNANDSHVSLIDPAISDEYILWTEYAYWDPRYGDPPRTSYIKAYNRKTGEIKNVAEYVGNSSGCNLIEYAIDGHRVVLSGDEPRFLVLSTGQAISLNLSRSGGWGPLSSPDLKGDYVVWSGSRNAAGPSAEQEGADLWGIDLKAGSNPVAVPLVIGPGNQVTPKIAGDKLVWLNSTDPSEQGIGIMSLSAAFATASDRQKELDRILPQFPTPGPQYSSTPAPTPTSQPAPQYTPTAILP